MATLYIDQHGITLRKSDERLLVTRGKERLLSAPVHTVQQVVILGNSTITAQAVEMLLNHHIEVIYLSSSGKYRGRLQPAISFHAPLRQAQYHLAQEQTFCLAFSREIILAKIRNVSLLIQRQARHTTINRHDWQRFRYYLNLVTSAKSLESLRGYEGAAASLYFSLFARLLKDPMTFRNRIKHPPPDPVNVLLSLGYTLLFNQIYAMVNLVGLDPYQGFYHQCRAGHPALVSDLMEEFRSCIIDKLVLRCINLGIIKRIDFEMEEQRVVLKKDALRRYLKSCTQAFNSFSGKRIHGKRYSFQQLFEHQCRHLARVIIGTESSYVPFKEE